MKKLLIVLCLLSVTGCANLSTSRGAAWESMLYTTNVAKPQYRVLGDVVLTR